MPIVKGTRVTKDQIGTYTSPKEKTSKVRSSPMEAEARMKNNKTVPNSPKAPNSMPRRGMGQTSASSKKMSRMRNPKHINK